MSISKFDLNVETMSRAELVKNYFDAVAMAEELGAPMLDWRVKVAKHTLSVRPAESEILVALLSGREFSADQLGVIVARSNCSDPKGLAKVYLCTLRKKLKPYGVKIESIWGYGYVMRPNDITRCNDLLEWHRIGGAKPQKKTR